MILLTCIAFAIKSVIVVIHFKTLLFDFQDQPFKMQTPNSQNAKVQRATTDLNTCYVTEKMEILLFLREMR